MTWCQVHDGCISVLAHQSIVNEAVNFPSESPQSQPSTSSTSGNKKTVYRTPDYSPLAGSSGGSGFRPSRRNGASGG
ncbi:hypothetical protein LSH36_541g01037 [Paralvinella palmiformis]|uniref:Uncharacterized protein n=1 Tax=Paralvinella palmiformis TaxID=53620 RepID=A0AAD9J8I7_9ANNE|nr:hypothetical protein LSH36_541g01037 [Paralvinella palmiformis]